MQFSRTYVKSGFDISVGFRRVAGLMRRLIKGRFTRPQKGLNNLAGTFVIAGFIMAALAASRLIVPLIAISLGASGLLVGVTAALFTAVPMVLSVPFGCWMDRAGTLVAVHLSAMMVVFASVLYWFMPGQYTLLAVAGLIGTAGVFTHMAATRAVGTGAADANRAKWLGYLVLSYSFFTFLGPVIASHAFEHNGSVVAISTLGGFALLTIIGTRVLPHSFKREEQVADPSSGSRRTKSLLAIQDLRLWILISSIFTANQTLYPFILSLHVAHIGLAASQAGWMLAAFALGTLTSRVFTPLLVRYIRPDVTLITALISAAGVYAFIPSAHESTTLIALSAALGLPLGVGTPVALAMIYEAAPQGRVNEALGISMSVNNLLQTVFPLFIGLAASGLGVAPMVWIWSCVILLSAFLTLLRTRRLQRDDC